MPDNAFIYMSGDSQGWRWVADPSRGGNNLGAPTGYVEIDHQGQKIKQPWYSKTDPTPEQVDGLAELYAREHGGQQVLGTTGVPQPSPAGRAALPGASSTQAPNPFPRGAPTKPPVSGTIQVDVNGQSVRMPWNGPDAPTPTDVDRLTDAYLQSQHHQGSAAGVLAMVGRKLLAPRTWQEKWNRLINGQPERPAPTPPPAQTFEQLIGLPPHKSAPPQAPPMAFGGKPPTGKFKQASPEELKQANRVLGYVAGAGQPASKPKPQPHQAPLGDLAHPGDLTLISPQSPQWTNLPLLDRIMSGKATDHDRQELMSRVDPMQLSSSQIGTIWKADRKTGEMIHEAQQLRLGNPHYGGADLSRPMAQAENHVDQETWMASNMGQAAKTAMGRIVPGLTPSQQGHQAVEAKKADFHARRQAVANFMNGDWQHVDWNDFARELGSSSPAAIGIGAMASFAHDTVKNLAAGVTYPIAETLNQAGLITPQTGAGMVKGARNSAALQTLPYLIPGVGHGLFVLDALNTGGGALRAGSVEPIGQMLSGLAQSVNPFEPHISLEERITRMGNAGVQLYALLHGSVKWSRNAAIDHIAKEIGGGELPGGEYGQWLREKATRMVDAGIQARANLNQLTSQHGDPVAAIGSALKGRLGADQMTGDALRFGAENERQAHDARQGQLGRLPAPATQPHDARVPPPAKPVSEYSHTSSSPPWLSATDRQNPQASGPGPLGDHLAHTPFVAVHAGDTPAAVLQDWGFIHLGGDLWGGANEAWAHRAIEEHGLQVDPVASENFSKFQAGTHQFPNRSIDWHQEPPANEPSEPYTHLAQQPRQPADVDRGVPLYNPSGSSQARGAQLFQGISGEGHLFTEERLDPRTIAVLPNLQYKQAGIVNRAKGITDALASVHAYDQSSGGALSIWERKDGQRFVMNGHHRLDLAQRTNTASVLTHVYKETDGIDFNTARALGALQNLRDGKGTAIDAVAVLRDLGAPVEKLREYGLSTRSGVARDAMSLMHLSPEGIKLVAQGDVPEAVAAGVADARLDPRREVATLKDAARGELETRRQGELIAQQARNRPITERSSGTGDLFGEFDETLALAEQAKIADVVIRRLSANERLYKAMLKGKPVGDTTIDTDAQAEAAARQEFARRILATDPETARILEQEAAKYAQQPTKQQLERAIAAIIPTAESAAERRLGELQPGRLGQGTENGAPSGGSERNPAAAPERTAGITPQGQGGLDIPEDFELHPPTDESGNQPKPDNNPVSRKQPELTDNAGGDLNGQSGLGFESHEAGQQARFKPGRIEPKGEPGWTGGQISGIILDLGKAADRTITERVATAKRAAGVYYPGTAQTTVRLANDIGVSSHEIAHALDDKYGLVANWITEKTSPFDKELQWFWERGGSGGPDKPLYYNRAEGVAEFMRGWLINPAVAEAHAPDFATYMKRTLPADVLVKLQAVGTKIRQWEGASPLEKTKSVIRTEKPAEESTLLGRLKSLIHPDRSGESYETSKADYTRMHFTDALAPFVSATKEAARRRGTDFSSLRPSENPVTLARTLAYFPQRFEAVVEHGMTNAEGDVVTPPAKYLLAPLDRSSSKTLMADLKDMEALLVSQRTSEKANVIAADAENELATKAKEMYDALGNQMAALEGTMRKAERARIAEAERRAEAEAQVRDKRGEGLSSAQQKKIKLAAENWLANEKKRISDDADARIKEQIDKIQAVREKDIEKALARIGNVLAHKVATQQAKLTGAGGGFHSATNIADQTIAQLQRVPIRYGRLQIAAEAYRNWADSVLQYMRDKGRISNDAYNAIKSRNQQYAAMQRFLGEERGIELNKSGGMAGAKDTLKKFVGSTATIDSPLANLLQNTFAMMKEADRNEVLRAFTGLLKTDRSMYEGQPANLAAIGQLVDAGTPEAIRVFDKGKESHWLLEKGVRASVAGMTTIHVPSFLGHAAELPVRVLKGGVTAFPGFRVRNRIRDTVDTLVKSDSRYKPGDWIRKASPEEQRLYQFFGGGVERGHYLDDAVDFHDMRDKLIDEMRLDKKSVILDTPRKIATWWQDAGQASEMKTRLAEVRANTRSAPANYSLYDKRLLAHQSARDLIDFAQGGNVTKFLGRYLVPFLNAQVQGARSLYNMAGRSPAKFALRWATFVAMPSVAEFAWNNLNGNLDEYRSLPAWQRDMFWNFKVGHGIWLRIPKPWEAGVMASGLVRGIDKAMGNENAFDGYAGSVAKAMFPLDESAAAAGPLTFVQARTNTDLFRNKAIVPPYEDDLDMSLRKGTGDASRLGQMIQAATGLDARKVDFLLRGYLGEAGSTAVLLSDISRSDKPIAPSRWLNMATGLFSESPSTNATDVQWVLETARQAGVRENPLGRLIDAYYNAQDSHTREEMAADMESISKRMRSEALQAARGHSGKEEQLIYQKLFGKSPYIRRQKTTLDMGATDQKDEKGFGSTGSSSDGGFGATGSTSKGLAGVGN